MDCLVKTLPPHLWWEAAMRAIAINPANAPARAPAIAAGLVLPPQHLAILTSKYWGTKGVKLTVSFTDNPTESLRNKILQHMNAWGTKANVEFTYTQGSGEVRIARERGQGYWSYLGTDVHSIPQNQQTMNLDNFSDSTPDSEFYRVVRHETGHTLGFPHEHERMEIIALLDSQKTITYFQQHYGWDAQTTTEQVLTPLSSTEIQATSPDVRSIMCYDFAGACTKNGQPIPGGSDINELDYSFAAKLYPKAGGPVDPNPPTGGNNVTLKQITDTLDQVTKLAMQKVNKQGQQIIQKVQSLDKQAVSKLFSGQGHTPEAAVKELEQSHDWKEIVGGVFLTAKQVAELVAEYGPEFKKFIKDVQSRFAS